MKTYAIITFCCLIFFSIFFFIFIKDNESNMKLVVKDLRSYFFVIVTEKVYIKKNIKVFANLYELNKKKDTLIFFGSSIKFLKVGDTIRKFKDSPFFYKVQNKKYNKYIFTYIKREYISSRNFPKIFKDSIERKWKYVITE